MLPLDNNVVVLLHFSSRSLFASSFQCWFQRAKAPCSWNMGNTFENIVFEEETKMGDAFKEIIFMIVFVFENFFVTGQMHLVN